MKYIKIFRTLAVALTLALLASTMPSTPALAEAYLYVYPTKGEIGTSVNVYGAGFSANQSVRIYFSHYSASVGTYIGQNEIKAYELVRLATANNNGEFDTPFTVPIGLTSGIPENVQGGTYYIYVTSTNSMLIQAVEMFTVESVAKITLNQSSGYVGQEIKVSGTGFAADKSVTINFDGVAVGTARTDSLRSFTNATFTVPASYWGSHTVKAEDTSNNSATATFTTEQSATITPTSGIVGDTVTASGTGFQATKTITITFDGVEVGKATSDAKGSFNTSVPVPLRVAGIYKVAASDGTYAASTDFAISVSMLIGQTTGYVGDNVTVRGTGFQTGKQIPIIFDNNLVKTTSTDNYGRFSASFTVPVRVAGTYTVKVSDGINIAEADFTVLTSASISPITSAASPGYVGTTLTISGIGFIAGRTVTITYDGTQVAVTTVNLNGTFSTSFNTPASRGGQHTIIATDGTTTRQFTFVMESTPPPIPAPLKPEMGIKAETETYFDWEDVTDPSGVTYTLQIATAENFSQASIVLDRTELTDSEYTITKEERLESVSKETPYYWHVKAVDGTSSESGWSGTGSFYLGFSWALSQPVIYILFGIGALVIILLAFWLGRRTAYH